MLKKMLQQFDIQEHGPWPCVAEQNVHQFEFCLVQLAISGTSYDLITHRTMYYQTVMYREKKTKLVFTMDSLKNTDLSY